MDSQSKQQDIVVDVRRFLEDLKIFEGDIFSLPEAMITRERGESPKETSTALDNRECTAPRVVGSQSAAVTVSLAGDPSKSTTTAEVGKDLKIFHREICECTRCALGTTRQNFVFGAGNPTADIVFIGEAPGAEEDRSGEPFVGPAGKLLTRIVEAMQLCRDDVYICNVLKCRPPHNRDPSPEEIATCRPYLERQLDLIAPKVICTLGRFAAQTLLETNTSMRRLRGLVHEYRGVPLVCTYHPAALLRNPQWKRPTWDDVRLVRRLFDGMEL